VQIRQSTFDRGQLTAIPIMVYEFNLWAYDFINISVTNVVYCVYMYVVKIYE